MAEENHALINATYAAGFEVRKTAECWSLEDPAVRDKGVVESL